MYIKPRTRHIVNSPQVGAAISSLSHVFLPDFFFSDFLPHFTPTWFSFYLTSFLAQSFSLINFSFSIFPRLSPLIPVHPPVFTWADSLSQYHVMSLRCLTQLFLSGQSWPPGSSSIRMSRKTRDLQHCENTGGGVVISSWGHSHWKWHFFGSSDEKKKKWDWKEMQEMAEHRNHNY